MKFSIFWGIGIVCGIVVVFFWVFWGLMWVWGEIIVIGCCLFNFFFFLKFLGFLSYVLLFVENFYWDKVIK